MIGLSNGPGFTPQKTQVFGEKMLRLLKIFFLKNSSPFFLKPWRARASNINILLIGAIKHYNFFYCNFLLRPFVSEMFPGPFHQAKAESSSRNKLQSKYLLIPKSLIISIWSYFWYGMADILTCSTTQTEKNCAMYVHPF